MNRAERRRHGVKVDLIETEWVSLAKAIKLSERDNPIQYQETRRAFFSGAFSLFHSIMKILDPGLEPTEKDLLQMEAIEQEMNQFFLIIGSAFEGKSMAGRA